MTNWLTAITGNWTQDNTSPVKWTESGILYFDPNKVHFIHGSEAFPEPTSIVGLCDGSKFVVKQSPRMLLSEIQSARD